MSETFELSVWYPFQFNEPDILLHYINVGQGRFYAGLRAFVITSFWGVPSFDFRKASAFNNFLCDLSIYTEGDCSIQECNIRVWDFCTTSTG